MRMTKFREAEVLVKGNLNKEGTRTGLPSMDSTLKMTKNYTIHFTIRTIPEA